MAQQAAQLKQDLQSAANQRLEAEGLIPNDDGVFSVLCPVCRWSSYTIRSLDPSLHRVLPSDRLIVLFWSINTYIAYTANHCHAITIQLLVTWHL